MRYNSVLTTQAGWIVFEVQLTTGSTVVEVRSETSHNDALINTLMDGITAGLSFGSRHLK